MPKSATTKVGLFESTELMEVVTYQISIKSVSLLHCNVLFLSNRILAINNKSTSLCVSTHMSQH